MSTINTIGGYTQIAGAVAQIGEGVALTISAIKDQKQQQQFAEAIARLSLAQQQDLNDKLLAANTQTDRLKILSDSIVQYLSNAQTSSDKKSIILYALGGVVVIGILITALIIYNKKK